jgi:hypothetical protein
MRALKHTERRIRRRVAADCFAPKVLEQARDGQSYREIGQRLGLSKNNFLDIDKRDRSA